MGCEGGADGVGDDVTEWTGRVVLMTGFVGVMPRGCLMVSIGVVMREDWGAVRDPM